MMAFNLQFKNINEDREIPHDNYTIKELLNDLGLSTQNIVAKQNNELVYEESEIKDNDEIKLIQIIYGG